MLVTGIFPMDIVDLDDMGLIDSSTEFISTIGDTPVLFAQEDGTVSLNSGDLTSLGQKVAYVTIPSFVQIVQDSNSQNVGYLINNDQLDSGIIVNEDDLRETVDTKLGSAEDSLQKQFADLLASSNILVSSDSSLKSSNKDSSTSEKKLSVVSESDVNNLNETKLFKCDVCNLRFGSRKLFMRHKWKHVNDKPYKCNFCHDSFNHEINLNLHLATHNVNDPFCPVCKKKFTRMASLRAHLMLHEQEDSIFCTQCGEEFTSPVYLEKHMAEHLSEKMQIKKHAEKGIPRKKQVKLEKVFQCTHCKLRFKSLSERKVHLAKAHKGAHSQTGTKTMRRGRGNVCEFCQKYFKKPSQLLRHKRIHTGERPYKCELCTRAFNQKGSLRIHMLKHTRERPYVCQYCNGTFSQKGNLKAHVRRLHMAPENDEPVYKCRLCSCMFRKLGSLNAHFTKAHSAFSSTMTCQSQITEETSVECRVDTSSDSSNKENESAKTSSWKNITDNTDAKIIISDEKPKTLTCSYCFKHFKRPGDLVRHSRIHTLEKPFKCKVCGKCFTLQSTLSVHLRSHNSRKKYACITCCKYYSSLHTLKLHKKKHVVNGDKQSSGRDPDSSYEYSHKVPQVVEEAPPEEPALVCLDQVDMSSLDATNIILTENAGNIVDLSSDIGEDDEERRFECVECDLVFKKDSDLTLHKQTHRGKYRCSSCPCSFSSQNRLTSHVKHNHTITVLSNYECSVCKKQFPSESSLKRHTETHVTDFPWACPFCGWAFKSFPSCKRHVASSHPKEKKNTKSLKLSEKSKETTNNQGVVDEDDKSALVASNTSELHAELKDLITIQPNQLYLITNEDGSYVVPQKTFCDSGLEDYSVFQESDLVLNNASSVESQKQVLNSNALQTCIFTLQPEVDVNAPVINSTVPPLLTPLLPQQLNRGGMNSVVLNNVSDFPVKSTQLLETPHTCITCGKSFSSAIEYEEHMTIHKSMSGRNEMKDNRAEAICSLSIQAPTTIYCCSECDFNFSSLDDLKRHQQEIHINTSEELAYICEFCIMSFSSQEELEEHRKEHTFIEQVIHCSICEMDFCSDENYQAHCEKVHTAPKVTAEKRSRISWKNEPRRLTDEEVEALSTIEPDNESEKVLLQSLMEKEKYEQLVKEKPKAREVHRNQCVYCSKSFRKPSDLVRHVRTHTGERPYQCTSCDKRFSMKSTAASHMRTHLKDKSYRCYICCKDFATTGSLKIHMRLHTGLKPFACDLCDAKFRTSGHKKAHTKKHFQKNQGKVSKETKDKFERKSELSMIGPKSDVPPSDLPLLPDELITTKVPPLDQGSQYLVPIRSAITAQGSVAPDENDGYVIPFEVSSNDQTQASTSAASKFLLNINDEGGGSGDAPRYLLSIKDTGTGEDGFVLETISDDQIIVTITNGDNILKTSEQEPLQNLVSEGYHACNICNKTFSRKCLLEKHTKKLHEKEVFQCTVCMERFERKSDLDVHCLAHELDREYTCTECSECFSLEEELRAHKCIKSVSLDLSLDQDLFLFS